MASVQRDLKACVIEGCSVVFRHDFEVELRAVMPGDGQASAKFYCADIVGSLAMKGLVSPLYRGNMHLLNREICHFVHQVY